MTRTTLGAALGPEATKALATFLVGELKKRDEQIASLMKTMDALLLTAEHLPARLDALARRVAALEGRT